MDIKRIVLELKSERLRIDRAIDVLTGTDRSNGEFHQADRKRQMSAQARRRISAAMKRRWADSRKEARRKPAARAS